MNANRANQQSMSARTGAALIGSAAITVAMGVLGVTAHDNGQNQTAIAHPSGGHTVTIEPHVILPTVTPTRPSSSPPTPFAAPPVRAPQSGAV
jgi:methylmalonyl-CoA mutase cobalamin-binding subunit